MTVNELLGLSGEPFIRAAYRAILGRDVDDTGLDHYLGRLARGDKRISVLSELANSPEAVARASHHDLAHAPAEIFIDVIYRRLLGRSPDPVGKESYLAALRRHSNRQLVIQDIETSVEARKRNGESARFKEDLVRALREEGELPVSLDDIMSRCGEAFVRRAYIVLLGRDADEVGLRHYLDRLRRGCGKAGVLEELLRSEEAKRHAAHRDLDSMSDSEFLEVIYQRLLGRPVDEDGRKHYLVKLAKNGQRRRIIKKIESSAEGKIRKSKLRVLRRDLKDLLREDRHARSWWRSVWRGRWLNRRINQIEYQLDMATERLDSLLKRNELGTRIEHAPARLKDEAERTVTSTVQHATRPDCQEPKPRPSIFNLLDGIPCDKPTSFVSALADRIESSKEAEAFGGPERRAAK
jgi:hypothetical protein